MNIALLNQIKRLVVVALASDDELMEQLVLKGGNAIDLVYQSSDTLSRASFDLDYSIDGGDFDKEELEQLIVRIEKTLHQTFLENNFQLLDYKFTERPKTLKGVHANFWGGYSFTFKLLQIDQYNKLGGDVEKARRSAISVNQNNSPVFEVELSKYEYVERKIPAQVDGYKIYVYSPEMIAFEKVRALCQQLPQYSEVVPSHSPRARARDFYDIYYIAQSHAIHLESVENAELFENIFQAKKVPLEFLKLLRENLSFHRDNWQSVVDTLSIDSDVKDFDFYAEYVLQIFENYKPLG